MFDVYRMEFIILVDNSQLRKWRIFSIEYSGKVAHAITGTIIPQLEINDFVLIDWSVKDVPWIFYEDIMNRI
jgi:hypothetical protein